MELENKSKGIVVESAHTVLVNSVYGLSQTEPYHAERFLAQINDERRRYRMGGNKEIHSRDDKQSVCIRKRQLPSVGLIPRPFFWEIEY
jgi:hypothetical protein